MKTSKQVETLAARLKPSHTEITVTAPYTKIEAKYANGSWFILTLDDATGVLSLSSDWGDYVHRWEPNWLLPDETFAQFILERANPDDICLKITSREQRLEVDVAATNEAIESALRGILEDDEFGEYDEDQLDSDINQLTDWCTPQELFSMSFYLLEDYELPDLLVETEKFWCGVIRTMVLPLCQNLWFERKTRIEAAAEQRAAHDALYPEHTKFREIDLESRALGEFLEFLQEENYLDPRVPPFRVLLSEYYEIDLRKFSDEKDRMLAALQAEAVKNG